MMKIVNSTMISLGKRQMQDNIKLYKFSEVINETFPFNSIVLLNNVCTGSLISCKHILTAAHCLHDGKKT